MYIDGIGVDVGQRLQGILRHWPFLFGGSVQATGDDALDHRVRAHLHRHGHDREDAAEFGGGDHVPHGDADGEDGAAGRRHASGLVAFFSYSFLAFFGFFGLFFVFFFIFAPLFRCITRTY